MNLAKLLTFFETSPAVRLLRSPNAPFIIAFLHQQFKRGGRITVPFSELHTALVAYGEEIQEAYPDALRDRPATYLAGWCSSDSRWLHRIIESGRNEPSFQLTPHTEDVFALLDRVLEQDFGFVGTESRLRLIIETLADVVLGSSDDPETRLAHLRSEKARIEEEIRQIESDGTVTRYHPAQIRERFATAVSLLKQLQGDFRAVEERFREITRQVQQRQNEGRDSRGGILEFALDAEDLLKREDQGVSFYEFVRFILSPAEQERLQGIIQKLGRIQELADQGDGLETVRRMIPLLLAEAEKVVRTNRRLSVTLRRLLDVRARRDRQRVSQLCEDILALATARAGERRRNDLGVEVDTRVAMMSPFTRTFWSEPPRFNAIDLCEHEEDENRRADAFRTLAQMRRLDWRKMRGRVKERVENHGPVTLGELLAEYPPEAGVVEVVGYLQIAHEDGHFVSPEAEEAILLESQKGEKRTLELTIPLARFLPT